MRAGAFFLHLWPDFSTPVDALQAWETLGGRSIWRGDNEMNACGRPPARAI